jgi:hypothetical protein
MIQMTPESQAFLDAMVPAEGSVSTDHTDAVYDLLRPIHDVLAATEAHWQAIDALRLAADRVEENPQVYGWFERFKQTIDAARRINAEAKRAVEAISDVCFQLDTYAREMRAQLAVTVDPPRQHVVNLNADHYKAMQATIEEQDRQLRAALTELNALKDKPK